MVCAMSGRDPLDFFVPTVIVATIIVGILLLIVFALVALF